VRVSSDGDLLAPATTAPANPPYWHIVYTKPRQELRALQQLQQQQFEVFLPTIAVERRQRGRLLVVDEALFSRYLFIRFDHNRAPWHRIRNTLGVSSLLTIGTEPAQISDAMVQSLMQRTQAPLALYQQGDPVHVVDGPFSGLEGIFAHKDGEMRAMVLIELLNKTQRLILPMEAIAPGGLF
jgi:transcriptional antiterminator RfaH